MQRELTPDEWPDWNEVAYKELTGALGNVPDLRTPKNMVLFIGDGMGLSTITAARAWLRQEKSKQGKAARLKDAHMSWDHFPHSAITKVYSATHLTPDSAATGSAMMCGEKVDQGTICTSSKAIRGNCTSANEHKLRSILKYAQDEGKHAGIVSTTRITHATPAVTYANAGLRDWEEEVPDDVPGYTECKDIADQLVHDPDAQKMRVVLGGGLQKFLPNTMSAVNPDDGKLYMGDRKDGRNLIDEWHAEKKASLNGGQYRYVTNRTELLDVDTDNVDYLLGLFNPDHMLYEVDRVRGAEKEIREPSLAEMVRTALSILKRGPDGFFLMVEGGRIDHAHHDNMPHRSIGDTIAFNDAVQMALDVLGDELDDTLFVVTSDHSHVFTVAGYPTHDMDILGTYNGAEDGQPYTIVNYANGPGYYVHRAECNKTELECELIPGRKDLTDVDTTGKFFVFDAGVPRSSETHGAEDVGIYAQGPMSYIFTGVHEQHFITHAMLSAACLGPYKDTCLEMRPASPTGQATNLVPHHWVLFSLLCALLLLR